MQKRITPTHFVEVFKHYQSLNSISTDKTPIKYFSLYIAGTIASGGKTIAVFKIKEK